jgi:hypothetical protein
VKNHPAGNQVIIQNADILLRSLQERGIQLSDFFANDMAVRKFCMAHNTNVFSRVSKDAWLDDLVVSPLAMTKNM